MDITKDSFGSRNTECKRAYKNKHGPPIVAKKDRNYYLFIIQFKLINLCQFIIYIIDSYTEEIDKTYFSEIYNSTYKVLILSGENSFARLTFPPCD